MMPTTVSVPRIEGGGPRTTAAERTPVHLRWMTRCRDVAAILEIAAASFPHPWTEEDLLRQTRRGAVLPIVAEWGDEVVGFCLYEIGQVRLHLLQLAVHPAYRRRGIGEQLVQRVRGKLSAGRRALLTVVVAEENLSAQRFFHSLGFRAVQVLRGGNGSADGYLMHFRLSPR